MIKLHELTWDEACAAGVAGQELFNYDGDLVCGEAKPFDYENLFSHHSRSVAKACCSKDDTVNTKAAAVYHNNVETYRAGDKSVHFKKPRPAFAWSYSRINDFINCPRAFYHKHIKKTIKFEETKAIREGNRVHKTLENRLGPAKIPLPPDLKDAEKYCRVIEANSDLLLVEKQLCIDQSMGFVTWFAKDAWGRGAFDVLSAKDGVVRIYDWKTGKIRDSMLQLKMFAAFASLFLDDCHTFITKYIWLKDDQVTPKEPDECTFTREQMPEIWAEIMTYVQRMAQAIALDEFPARPSGLCGWCQVGDCQHRR